jgi:hypothetical protein
MSEGHALLVYQLDNNWMLYDPNFGTALFPTSSGGRESRQASGVSWNRVSRQPLR